MQRFQVEIAGRIDSHDVDTADGRLVALMDALVDRADIVDPDLTATLATGAVIVAIGIEADTQSEAAERAKAVVESTRIDGTSWL